MLLGEAASRCEHVAGIPLRPDIAQSLHQLYLAKGAHATTAIEGNTLSEQEALLRIKGELTLPASREYLGRELDNIVGSFNRIGELLRVGDDALTPERVRDFNLWILENLKLEEGVVPGAVRRHGVTVGRAYLGAPAEDCGFLLDRLCEWLSGPDLRAPRGMEIVYAIIKAVVAHIYIAWIHPFGDGNGRTARLMEFQILLSAGVPTPAAHLLSNHYNQTRSEYYRQLESASRSGGDVIPFLEYATQGFVDGLREQLAAIRSQQWDVAWENFVYEEFRERTGRTARRQRGLVLNLGRLDKSIQPAMVRDLSPDLAREYAGKTSKTVQRDLGALMRMDLVERTPEGFKAKKEKILAFLPWSKSFVPRPK
jgi:Fic family protein